MPSLVVMLGMVLLLGLVEADLRRYQSSGLRLLANTGGVPCSADRNAASEEKLFP